VADLIKDSDPDDGDQDDGLDREQPKEIDLSAEMPTPRLGTPWRKEAAPEITVRGTPAVMLTSVLCMVITFVILRLVVGMNPYIALVLAFIAPLLYGGWREGGKIRLILRMWRGRSSR
jgi:hypothetical protein